MDRDADQSATPSVKMGGNLHKILCLFSTNSAFNLSKEYIFLSETLV
jgi:hypothetical protein